MLVQQIHKEVGLHQPVTLILKGERGALYLGNIMSLSPGLVRSYDIGAIISLLYQAPPEHDYQCQPAQLYIQAEDSPSFDIACHFQECISFIIKHLAFTNVLVHCYAGISRSSTVIIAYLIFIGKTLPEAIRIVREKRAVACPNTGFLFQLVEFDQKCQAYRKDLEKKQPYKHLKPQQKSQTLKKNGSKVLKLPRVNRGQVIKLRQVKLKTEKLIQKPTRSRKHLSNLIQL